MNKHKLNLRIVIVDGEPPAQRLLRKLIEDEYGAKVIVGVASSFKEAQQQIIYNTPNLLLLDVNLSPHSGFELLQSIPVERRTFEVIFITNFADKAIRAIDFAAVGYILKPITTQALYTAVDKAIDAIQKKEEFERLKNLMDNLQSPITDKQKITLPLVKGRKLTLKVKNIIRLESSGDVTMIHIDSKLKNKITVNKGLQDCFNLLKGFNFFQIHRQHVVNFDYINEFNATMETVELIFDEELPVARRRKKEFLNAYDAYRSRFI